MRRAVALLVTLVVSSSLAACRGGGGGYPLTAEFARGVSLYEASDVRVLGLPAGRITDVDVDGKTVVVKMRIDDDIVLPADVRATIVPLSLIGERYVQLTPAWTPGRPRLPRGSVIRIDRTSVPVEPDEALEAFKEFLDALDPNATGRLVRNLAEGLDGRGQQLNDALEGLGTVASAFADKDEQLGAIVDNLDRLTATLQTREARLGAVMDDFASVTQLLAAERDAIERLVRSLAQLSVDALGLVGEHRDRLDRDLTVLGRTLRSVSVHMESVLALVDSAPLSVAGPNFDGTRGLHAAYDPEYHHIDLRNATTPELAQLFDAIGVGSVEPCVPGQVMCGPPPRYSASLASLRSAELDRAADRPAEPDRSFALSSSAAVPRPSLMRRLGRLARSLAAVVA